ncbi:MAG: hypothetical protein A2Y21_06945 [Clostridiales bacterium GWC2_40_7]|nr:MAG: hypothetical protein A2Y21_06945 [Clostridiales bacterium GWC2_40_7]
MKKPVLLRKRFIPYEIIDISSDDLLFRDERLLVTRWKAIKPRTDFYGGISYTFLDEGIKLARFYNEQGIFLYWYCDIIDVLYNEERDEYTFLDLLVDVKILPGGAIRVLDTEELAEALEKGLVTLEQACRALRTLDRVLKLIYDNKFPPEECKEFEY